MIQYTKCCSHSTWFSSLTLRPVSLYSLHKDSTLIVLVYVDDIIVTGSSHALIQSFIQKLQALFALKDLGPLHYFLGIEVSHFSTGLHLSQGKYIRELLIRANMQLTNPSPSPMISKLNLSQHDGDPFDNPTLYRSIVGALQYATLTRPNISYSVNKVSQFMQSPTTEHWATVKRILRYLQGSLSHGLLLKPASSFTLHAYSDADWAGSIDDRRSTTGYCVFLGPNLISWSSKKQATVSRLSTESEYRSLANTCAEVVWLQYLLTELHISLSNPPILWCDNVGATFLASNPMFHARTKHVEIDYHFIREKVASNSLLLRFISTHDQIVDVFTKPLAAPRFSFLRNKLTVIASPIACGGANRNKLDLSSNEVTGVQEESSTD